MGQNTCLHLLIQMLMSLGWKDVLVLHDDRIDTSFFPSLELHNITYVNYDITFSTDEHLLNILSETHQVIQPVLHLLLMCDNLLAVRVLEQMETFDVVSKVSFDMRHSSRVLMMGSKSNMDTIVAINTLVENIAVVELPRAQDSYRTISLWTLVFSSTGREFTHVALPTWPVVKLPSVFPNIQYGYNGRQLTVVLKQYTFPHGYITVGDVNVSGLQYRTLEHLAQNLNFSFKIVHPQDNEWGRDIDGSWTGVIGMLQRKEADLAAETLTINKVRESVVDHLLPPLMENKVMIVYKMEEENENNLRVYLHPFQPVVYLVVTVSVILYSSVLCFERVFHEIRLPNETGTAVNLHKTSRTQTDIRHQPDVSKHCSRQVVIAFLSTLYETLGATLRQGSPKIVSRASERLLVSSWWIFTVIIATLYCGAILASFAVKIQKPPFTNLAELALRQDYKIGYDSSTILAIYFENSTNSDAMVVRNKVRESAVSDPDVLSSDLSKHFDKIQKGKYAFLVGVLPATYKARTNCRWKTIDSRYGSSYFSFAVPKLSPFKKDFEKSMHRLRNKGILQNIQEEWLKSIPEDRCPIAEFPRPISLTQLTSIFIVVGIGICCGIIALCFEIIFTKVCLFLQSKYF